MQRVLPSARHAPRTGSAGAWRVPHAARRGRTRAPRQGIPGPDKEDTYEEGSQQGGALRNRPSNWPQSRRPCLLQVPSPHLQGQSVLVQQCYEAGEERDQVVHERGQPEPYVNVPEVEPGVPRQELHEEHQAAQRIPRHRPGLFSAGTLLQQPGLHPLCDGQDEGGGALLLQGTADERRYLSQLSRRPERTVAAFFCQGEGQGTVTTTRAEGKAREGGCFLAR
mmetsp:Transcript_14188/g.55833  ORF Transcript_14188/g.55833 Transcript_14188/m.55833 type:complete len:223 (+) Transcript_14188:874-1542(+)